MLQKLFSSGVWTGNKFFDEQIHYGFQKIAKTRGKKINLETGSFRESMNRRFRRDVMNMEEYYDSLKKEMEASLKNPVFHRRTLKTVRQKQIFFQMSLQEKKMTFSRNTA